jgi:hypothetical protein
MVARLFGSIAGRIHRGLTEVRVRLRLARLFPASLVACRAGGLLPAPRQAGVGKSTVDNSMLKGAGSLTLSPNGTAVCRRYPPSAGSE